MSNITQLRLPFTGRKKKPEQRPPGLIPKREQPRKPRKVKVTQKDARTQAIEILGGKCARCGFSDVRALQIDHIKNNGNDERKQIQQYAVYKRVYDLAVAGKADGEYQVLCANCNWIKRHEHYQTRRNSKFRD